MSPQAARYYYLYDGQGNVTGLINSAGAQVATYSSDPYGTTTAMTPTGTWPPGPMSPGPPPSSTTR